MNLKRFDKDLYPIRSIYWRTFPSIPCSLRSIGSRKIPAQLTLLEGEADSRNRRGASILNNPLEKKEENLSDKTDRLFEIRSKELTDPENGSVIVSSFSSLFIFIIR